MIRANELRIGNFVINEMGHKIEVNYNTLCNIVEFEAVYEPIPLTEEWLDRFGFPLKAKHRIEDNFDSYYYMSFDLESMSLYSDVGDFSLCNRINWTKIQYVHQLQNLYFALTGQELQLKEKID